MLLSTTSSATACAAFRHEHAFRTQPGAALDAPALRRHAVKMSPRVRAVLEIVSEMTEDERNELRHELGTPAEGLDEATWTATWNRELSRRLGQIERGEVQLLTEEELFANDEE
ncbi:MAG: hypothetical protein ABSE49_20865 [Polyangiaceae bacterium]|jgi:hypothetical protein